LIAILIDTPKTDSEKSMSINTDYADPKDLFGLQSQKFEEVVAHLFATPFYRNKLHKAGFAPKDLTSLHDLVSLPFTTKDELRSTSPFERTPYALDDMEFLFSSNGTSGNPTTYFWTREDTIVLREAGARAMLRAGVTPKDIALVVAPMGMSIMWYCMVSQYNTIGAGVIPLGLRPPQEIIQIMFEYPITIVITLPVAVTRLFEFMISQNPSLLHHSSLRQFHCGGDFLSEARRRRIEEMWGVGCNNTFGMSEIFGPLAGECEKQDGMHILSDYIYIEVLDVETKQPVSPGQPGIAVYTTLWKKGAPLLRYWSNDFVVMNPEPCTCGRTSPRMCYLGRPVDMAILPDGRRLFAQQLENELFAFQVGNEFKLTLLDGPIGYLSVEQLPGKIVPSIELQTQLSLFLGMPVEISVTCPGSFDRSVPKPRRIEDQRKRTH